jgi:spore germination protein GerM
MMKTIRLPRAVALAICLAVAVATTGCGVAIQTSAQPLTVPRALFHAPSVPNLLRHGRPVDVYFLTRGHLVPSTRYIPSGKLTLDRLLQDTLNVLAIGPTTAEFRSGISTAMSLYPRAQLSLVGNVDRGVASVDLDSTFGSLDATQLFESDGQIVYTLTQFPGVSSVYFVFDGVREAFLDRGQVRYDDPVGRPDYLVMAPLAS